MHKIVIWSLDITTINKVVKWLLSEVSLYTNILILIFTLHNFDCVT